MLMGFCTVVKAVDQIKQRPPKLPHSPLGISEPSDQSATSPGRIRDGSDTQLLPATTFPTHSSPTTQVSEAGGQESESSKIFQFLFVIKF